MNSVNEAQINHLRTAENEIVGLFVELVNSFGAPKSLGALYGLLFASEKPLAFDQIVERLKMSTGSVSQGLKLLKTIGAIRTVFVPGERRDLFIAETQLRKLVHGFLRHRLNPQVANTDARLHAFLQEQSATELILPPHLQERLKLLERWQAQAKGVLPVLLTALESPAQ